MKYPGPHERILELLTTREWVSTSEICSAIGGSNNGTRRLRELRKDYGLDIETRPKVGCPFRDWEYRLKDRPQKAAEMEPLFDL